MTLFPNLLTKVYLYVNPLGWHVFLVCGPIGQNAPLNLSGFKGQGPLNRVA